MIMLNLEIGLALKHSNTLEHLEFELNWIGNYYWTREFSVEMDDDRWQCTIHICGSFATKSKTEMFPVWKRLLSADRIRYRRYERKAMTIYFQESLTRLCGQLTVITLKKKLSTKVFRFVFLYGILVILSICFNDNDKIIRRWKTEYALIWAHSSVSNGRKRKKKTDWKSLYLFKKKKSFRSRHNEKKNMKMHSRFTIYDLWYKFINVVFSLFRTMSHNQGQ